MLFVCFFKTCCTWKTLGHHCEAQPSSSLETTVTRGVHTRHVTVTAVQNHASSYLICVVWTRHKEKQPCKRVFAWHRIARTPWTWATFGKNCLNVRFHTTGLERILPLPRRPLRVRCVEKLPISHVCCSRKHFTAQCHTLIQSFFLEFNYFLHRRYLLKMAELWREICGIMQGKTVRIHLVALTNLVISKELTVHRYFEH